MSGVDWERLNSLRDDIGPEDFADVVLLFIAEIGEKLDDMGRDKTAATVEDFHFLRGSAANLGFTDMVAACEIAEAACRAGETPDVAAVAQGFENALSEALTQVPELAA
jgi:HPt (histidine-containing phosphotransfer) domain-containing protein